MWSAGKCMYTISHKSLSFENPTTFSVDIDVLDHIAFEYVDKRLTVWLNGKLKRGHGNLTLGNLDDISKGVEKLGIFSLYNRELSNKK